jgi:hypothetical protein
MTTPPKIEAPKCQFCGERLPILGLYAYEVPGYAILNLYCPHCDRAFHFQIFQRPPATAAPGEAPPKSTIWNPA